MPTPEEIEAAQSYLNQEIQSFISVDTNMSRNMFEGFASGRGSFGESLLENVVIDEVTKETINDQDVTVPSQFTYTVGDDSMTFTSAEAFTDHLQEMTQAFLEAYPPIANGTVAASDAQLDALAEGLATGEIDPNAPYSAAAARPIINDVVNAAFDALAEEDDTDISNRQNANRLISALTDAYETGDILLDLNDPEAVTSALQEAIEAAIAAEPNITLEEILTSQTSIEGVLEDNIATLLSEDTDAVLEATVISPNDRLALIRETLRDNFSGIDSLGGNALIFNGLVSAINKPFTGNSDLQVLDLHRTEFSEVIVESINHAIEETGHNLSDLAGLSNRDRDAFNEHISNFIEDEDQKSRYASLEAKDANLDTVKATAGIGEVLQNIGVTL